MRSFIYTIEYDAFGPPGTRGTVTFRSEGILFTTYSRKWLSVTVYETHAMIERYEHFLAGKFPEWRSSFTPNRRNCIFWCCSFFSLHSWLDHGIVHRVRSTFIFFLSFGVWFRAPPGISHRNVRVHLYRRMRLRRIYSPACSWSGHH